jgi:hypothetical protein
MSAFIASCPAWKRRVSAAHCQPGARQLEQSRAQVMLQPAGHPPVKPLNCHDLDLVAEIFCRVGPKALAILR